VIEQRRADINRWMDRLVDSREPSELRDPPTVRIRAWKDRCQVLDPGVLVMDVPPRAIAANASEAVAPADPATTAPTLSTTWRIVAGVECLLKVG
jgi:hypothetical protein